MAWSFSTKPKHGKPGARLRRFQFMQQRWRPGLSAIVLPILLTALLAPLDDHGVRLQADVLKLNNGGEIDGILLNPDEDPRTEYTMQLESGGEITIKAEDVRKHVPRSDAQERYRAIIARMPATAEANWKVADWCKTMGLRHERQLHLEAAIQMDPNHEKARQALGYHRTDDGWKHRDDFRRAREEWMSSRGFQLHEGRWKLPQDIELDKKRREDELAAKRWAVDLKRWRTWWGKRQRTDQARAAIQAIDDPRAVPAVASALENENQVHLATLYVKVLAKFRSPRATQALVKTAMATENLDLLDACLDALEVNGRELAVDAFIHSLGSTDNASINRAAVGLQRLVEPRATRPLIDVLVTKHKFKIGKDNPGQISTSFGSGPSGGGIGFGSGSRAKVVEKPFNNPEVLNALLLLSDGANFDYDVARWKQWYALRDTPDPHLVDLRREP